MDGAKPERCLVSNSHGRALRSPQGDVPPFSLPFVPEKVPCGCKNVVVLL